MRVHLYGNINNNSYKFTKYLRAVGIDAHFFLDDLAKSPVEYPWWEDKDLDKDNLPEWIHYHRTTGNYFWPNKGMRKMIAEFAKGDIALVCGFGSTIAKRAKIPFVMHSYGQDLAVLSYRENFRRIMDTKTYDLKSRLKYLVGYYLFSKLQKWALKDTERICIFMGFQINQYLPLINSSHKLVMIRKPIDVDRYQQNQSNYNADLQDIYGKYKRIFFMPARQDWRSVWQDLKGNDKFYRAFKLFVDKNECTPDQVRIIAIKKGVDVLFSQQLIEELGIGDYIEWRDELKKYEIAQFYTSLTNLVVVDQFFHDDWKRRFKNDEGIEPKLGFGLAGLEAMSAGKPILTLFNDFDFYPQGGPTIFSAYSIEEIKLRLIEIWNMSTEDLSERGSQGYEFVVNNHDFYRAIGMYVRVLSDYLTKVPLIDPRQYLE